MFYCFWEILNILLIIYIVFTLYICFKKWELKYSILLILLPLLYFKYSYFFLDIFNIHIFEDTKQIKNIPLGISFITFTAIALLIDTKNKIFEEKLDFKSLTEFILYFLN